MADDADATEERIEFDTEISVRNIRDKASLFDPGQSGDCSLCGETFPRVVEVVRNDEKVLACGRCRDRFGLS